MGKGNAAVRQWMSDRKRFADLFNGSVFHGEQIVMPDALKLVESESDILLTDKEGKKRELQRHRDIIMRWQEGAVLALLACENQSKIHYAMPVRNMLYDSMSYADQIRQLWEVHREEKMTNEEFLSKFRKEDTLCPIITLVLYYDEKKWEGSLELYDMFPKSLEEKRNLLKNYVANYRINLVDVGHMEHIENFKTDLQEIFGMLKYRGKKKELVRYVNENADYFKSVDESTYHVIEEFLHSDWMMKNEIKIKESGGKVNMCKALEDLYNDGRSEGFDAGIIAGEKEHLLKLIQLKLAKGKAVEEIADALEEDEDTIRSLMEEIK